MTSSVFHVKEHIVPSQHIREYARATAVDQHDVLKLSVKQYTPIDNPSPQPGDVTIIGAHANGYPKELYEPLWIEMHARSKANGFRIRGIWIMDVANQGASGILNEHVLGNDPSWMDIGRDLLHWINVFSAEMPQPIVGVGHSMGGCGLVNLALMHPRLLTTLCLTEPVINPHKNQSDDIGLGPARASTFRRDLWPSKEAALAAFKKQKYYQAWDPRVLEIWIENGLRKTPTPIYPDAKNGEATLSTTKHQEVWTFLRPRYTPQVEPGTTEFREAFPDVDPGVKSYRHQFYRPEPPRTFDFLPNLRPSVLYLFGEESYMAADDMINGKLKTTGIGWGGSGGEKVGRVQAVKLKGTGHLAPMEVVGTCADTMVPWIAKELQRWRRQQEAYEKWVKETPMRDKRFLSEEYMDRMGRPKKSPPKANL